MFEFVGGHEEHPWDWKSSIRVREWGLVVVDVMVDGLELVVEVDIDIGVDIWDVSGAIQTSSDFLNIFLRFHILSESTI